MKEEKYFTIAQAANACGISRSTLLRLEDEGLLTPAIHENGQYRYFSTENVLQAMQITALHRMGLTRRDIRPIVETPENIDGIIAQLEDLRGKIDLAITDLKKRTLQDSSTVTELLELPETLCYMKAYDVEGDRYDLRQYLMESVAEAIRAGCRMSWDRSPFIRTHRPDLAEGKYVYNLYRCYVCVPILNRPKDCSHLETVRARTILSVTWHGRVNDLPYRTLNLARQARDRGLKPTGWFHAITMLNAPKSDDSKSQLLQLGCVVE